MTAGRRFVAFDLSAASLSFGGASAALARAVLRTGCSGLITCAVVVDDEEPCPRKRKPPAPRTSTPRPTSAGTRSREFTHLLSAAKAIPFMHPCEKRKRAR